MSEIITKENFLDINYDVFRKFSAQWAIVTAGDIENYNCMTLSWGHDGQYLGSSRRGADHLCAPLPPYLRIHGRE